MAPWLSPEARTDRQTDIKSNFQIEFNFFKSCVRSNFTAIKFQIRRIQLKKAFVFLVLFTG